MIPDLYGALEWLIVIFGAVLVWLLAWRKPIDDERPGAFFVRMARMSARISLVALAIGAAVLLLLVRARFFH